MSGIHYANTILFYLFGYAKATQKAVLVRGADAKNICKPLHKARDDVCNPWVITATVT